MSSAQVRPPSHPSQDSQLALVRNLLTRPRAHPGDRNGTRSSPSGRSWSTSWSGTSRGNGCPPRPCSGSSGSVGHVTLNGTARCAWIGEADLRMRTGERERCGADRTSTTTRPEVRLPLVIFVEEDSARAVALTKRGERRLDCDRQAEPRHRDGRHGRDHQGPAALVGRVHARGYPRLVHRAGSSPASGGAGNPRGRGHR